jgi:hypothetical protein
MPPDLRSSPLLKLSLRQSRVSRRRCSCLRSGLSPEEASAQRVKESSFCASPSSSRCQSFSICAFRGGQTHWGNCTERTERKKARTPLDHCGPSVSDAVSHIIICGRASAEMKEHCQKRTSPKRVSLEFMPFESLAHILATL